MQAAQTQTQMAMSTPGEMAGGLNFATAEAPISAAARRMGSSSMRMFDLTGMTVALAVTLGSRLLVGGQGLRPVLSMQVSVKHLLVEAALLFAWRAIFSLMGMYQPRLNQQAITFAWRVPMAVAVCAATLAPLMVLAPQTLPAALRSGAAFWAVATGLLLATRAAYLTYDAQVRPAFRKRRNVLVVGTGPRAKKMVVQLATHPEYKYQLCGFVDSDPQAATAKFGPVLGGVCDLEELLSQQSIDEVVIALPLKSRFAETQRVVAICARARVRTQYSLDLFAMNSAPVQVQAPEVAAAY